MKFPSIRKFGTTGLFVLATIVFMASFAQGQLNQCSNGPKTTPPTPLAPCTGNNWVNGNIGSDSQYIEGDSVSFRRVGKGLTPGAVIVLTIEFDSTKAGKHAYDYLTSYDRTNAIGNNPCSDIDGCTLVNPSTAAIPLDPDVTNGPNGVPGGGDDITQVAGLFTLFGGTIQSVAPTYGLSGSYAGDSTRTLEITLLVGPANDGTKTNMVLAWGGHIASRLDWGINSSAAAIPGSPYHMSTDQDPDRSLSVDDVTFPARVRIFKDTQTPFPLLQGTDFDFVASLNFGAPNIFSLDDDADPTLSNVAERLILNFGAANAITVTEQAEQGWSILNLTCVEDPGGLPQLDDSTPSGPSTSPTATIIAQEGELIDCTYTNSSLQPTAADVFVEGRVVGTNGRGLAGISVTLTNALTFERRTAVTNTFGNFRFDDLEIGDLLILTASNKRYTFETLTFTLNDAMSGVTLVGTPK